MTVYKKKETSILKWVIALIIFTLGMTLTFSDVYGINIPGDNKTYETGTDQIITCNPDDDSNPDNPPPTAVPEPSTLILLSSGLGAMYALRKKNKK